LHQEKPVLKWSEGDTFVVDLITRSVNVYHNSCITVPPPTAGEGAGNSEGTPVDQTTQLSHSEYDGTPPSLRHDQGKEVAPLAVHEETSHSGDSEKATSKHQDLERVSESTSRHGSPTDSQTLKRPQQPPAVTIRESRRKGGPQVSSIVSEVFEGMLESTVKCLACKKVSVRREPFQDLSLPIPGRKEMAKFNQKLEGSVERKQDPSTLSRGFCTVWSFVTALTKDFFVGPPTDIRDCLNAFFDASELKGMPYWQVCERRYVFNLVQMCLA